MSPAPAEQRPSASPSSQDPDRPARRIAVTGSSGLVGSALVRALRADGRRVTRLVRRPPRADDEARWDPHGGDPAGTAEALRGCDAVVHLAGAGIADHRWTARYRRVLWDSRVVGTTALARAVADQEQPPAVFLSGSAIGYYGDTGDQPVTEDAPPGRGFLADLSHAWEAATDPAERAGVRTVHLRTGLVVARGGGAWGRLFPIFRAGLGGRMGDGRQYWSAISLRDHVAALLFLLDQGGAAPGGPVNLTGPEPVTNREVTAAMARVLRRPAVLPVPAPALRVALGGFASDVLGSQRVLPRRLLDSGFVFADQDIDAAVRAAWERAEP